MHIHAIEKVVEEEGWNGEEMILRARRGWVGVDWKELYRCRELLYFLVWRDVKVRYKQTVLGVAWAVLQPVFSMAIFTATLGKVAGMEGMLPPGLPYSIFVFAGLLPWMFYSAAFTNGGTSLFNQQQLLTKIYLPRLYVPTAAVGGAGVDMAISLGVLGILMALYRVVPGWGIVLLPILLALTIMAALGSAYLLSALTVTYRDFRFLMPFLLQSLMWLSFTVIPLGHLKPHWQWILACNPMFGIIKGYRSVLFGAQMGYPLDPITLTISALSAIGLLIFGMFYFRRMERRFADIA